MFLQEVLEGLFLLELLLSQRCPVKQPNVHHCHDHTSTQSWSRGESQSLPYLSTWYARNTLTSIYTRQTLRRDTNQQHCLDVLFHPAANPYIHSNKKDVYRNVKGLTLSPFGPGRPVIPLGPWAPCRKRFSLQTKHCQSVKTLKVTCIHIPVHL